MSPSEGILNWDIVALLGVNSLSGHWLIDWTVNLVAQNKLLNGTVFVAAYWYCWFGGGSDDTLKSRRVVLAGLASCLLAIVIARALADLLPFRVRPMLDPTSGFQPPLFPVTDDYEAWSSFPSDKAAFVFALAVALYAAVPRLSIALVIYAAAVVCLPRIWLGIHFPLDILVGAALGALAAWLCETFISRRLLDRLVALAERRQALFYAAAFVVTIELAYLFDNVRRNESAARRFVVPARRAAHRGSRRRGPRRGLRREACDRLAALAQAGVGRGRRQARPVGKIHRRACIAPPPIGRDRSARRLPATAAAR
jgi:undecaprenyl-diphosphatase